MKFKLKKSIVVLVILIIVIIGYLLFKPSVQVVDSLEQLKSLPYLTHSEEKANMSLMGVTLNTDKAYPGINYHTGQLIDM